MDEIFSKILKDKNGKVLNVGSKYTQPEWGAKTGAVVLPEITLTGDGELPITQEFSLIVGQGYTVNWNGTSYNCMCADFNGMACIGNVKAATGTGNTGEPFVIVRASDDEVANAGAYGIVMALDGSTSVTLSITGNLYYKIPTAYLQASGEPIMVRYYLNHDTGKNAFSHTFNEILAAINEGRVVYLKNETLSTRIYSFFSTDTTTVIVFALADYLGANVDVPLTFLAWYEDGSVYTTTIQLS